MYAHKTVFEVNASGTETVLYNFTGHSDGTGPMGGLVRDGAGNFCGTTGGAAPTAGEQYLSWTQAARKPCCTVLLSWKGLRLLDCCGIGLAICTGQHSAPQWLRRGIQARQQGQTDCAALLHGSGRVWPTRGLDRGQRGEPLRDHRMRRPWLRNCITNLQNLFRLQRFFWVSASLTRPPHLVVSVWSSAPAIVVW
jgi:hypothetical protein